MGDGLREQLEVMVRAILRPTQYSGQFVVDMVVDAIWPLIVADREQTRQDEPILAAEDFPLADGGRLYRVKIPGGLVELELDADRDITVMVDLVGVERFAISVPLHSVGPGPLKVAYQQGRQDAAKAIEVEAENVPGRCSGRSSFYADGAVHAYRNAAAVARDTDTTSLPDSPEPPNRQQQP